jgi:signal transduction histidine kinase
MGYALITGELARWLVPVIYVLCGLAFVSDLLRDNTLAYGLLYVPLIATSVFHENRNGVWLLATAAVVMVVLGALFPFVNANLPDLIVNRVLSVLAILATAMFVTYARTIQDRLMAQTRRAEAAERIKSDVLTNLTEELRTPMHKLLGLMSLMRTNCRPDQREALDKVRGGSRQLLETIDNLIDLTQFDDSKIRLQPIDITGIVGAAAEHARQFADERQIALSVDMIEPVRAVGDAWATRRIMDNLLANAIRLTPPGGLVSVAVSQDGNTATASVADTGNGIVPGFWSGQPDGDPAVDESLMTIGTELLLSKRLAVAMGCRLTTIDRPGGPGSVVSLSLPAGVG